MKKLLLTLLVVGLVGTAVMAKPCQKTCPATPQVATEKTVVKDCTCPTCEAAKATVAKCKCDKCTTTKDCTCPKCEKAKAQLTNCKCPQCSANGCTCKKCEKAKAQIEKCKCDKCTTTKYCTCPACTKAKETVQK